MANKFKQWVEDDNVNTGVQTYADFESDNQRSAGFQSGNPASSIRVNTALRQANLVACAIMDLLAPNDNTIDFRSTRDAVKAVLNAGLANITVGNATNATNSTNATNATKANKFTILTEAPTADNPDENTVQIVIAQNVSTYYNGYLYLNFV